jgi:hypothetical protein
MSDRQQERIWPITLEQIEATVAAHLGAGRVQGNKQDECFSRQISMYLAKHVGGWSTPQIGRFYNGRHHTTVLYAIQKIERLRKRDARVDALLEMLSGDLRPAATCNSPSRPPDWSNTFLDARAERILRHITSGEALPNRVNRLALDVVPDHRQQLDGDCTTAE